VLVNARSRSFSGFLSPRTGPLRPEKAWRIGEKDGSQGRHEPCLALAPSVASMLALILLTDALAAAFRDFDSPWVGGILVVAAPYVHLATTVRRRVRARWSSATRIGIPLPRLPLLSASQDLVTILMGGLGGVRGGFIRRTQRYVLSRIYARALLDNIRRFRTRRLVGFRSRQNLLPQGLLSGISDPPAGNFAHNR